MTGARDFVLQNLRLEVGLPGVRIVRCADIYLRMLRQA